MNVIYRGRADAAIGPVAIEVVRDGRARPLTHRVKHSPDGFGYGYHGSGASELARCILWDYLGEEPEPALYQDFKRAFVANVPDTLPFLVSGEQIATFLTQRDQSTP